MRAFTFVAGAVCLFAVLLDAFQTVSYTHLACGAQLKGELMSANGDYAAAARRLRSSSTSTSASSAIAHHPNQSPSKRNKV